jgi:hypothetical protein
MDQYTKKAIQDAIDFLDGSYEAHKIRKALQEVLAQPAQEPVAWMSPDRKSSLEFSRKDTVYGSHTIPLYTHPNQWQGLSDDEQSNIFKNQLGHDCSCDPHYFYLAIEQALKEKNT